MPGKPVVVRPTAHYRLQAHGLRCEQCGLARYFLQDGVCNVCYETNRKHAL